MSKVPDANNHLSGLTYDAGGNVTNDGLGGIFTYDGENRITTAGGVTYTYDADGRRIQKSSGTNYWYGPGGQVLAETDSAGNWTNYIFFGGQRLARNVPQPSPNPADIKYYITDHLHSTAMFVDQAGAVANILDDNDMYPWGGVVPGVGKTTSNNTIKFTGQYRDTDTAANLDYFGARYYSNTVGRFMSPDWAAKPTTVPYAKFGDPQSLNLYSYVENGPVNRIDADGHGFINEAFQDWGMDAAWADGGGDGTPQPQGQKAQNGRTADNGLTKNDTANLHQNLQNAGNQPQGDLSSLDASTQQPQPQQQPQPAQQSLTYKDPQHVPPAAGELHEVLACTQSCSGSGFVITSTSEPIPQHPANTPHGRGEAADLRVAPSDEQRVLQCAANCGAGYAQNERLNPSAHATAPHIHVQVVPGRNGGRGDLPQPTVNLRVPQP